MENRAAVFTREPQAVEVYQAGAWWSGELLGWRHAADGSCQVWVRVVLDGVEETAWTALETLRLPERRRAMAPEPAAVRSPDRELSVARHPSSRREHRADAGSSTASLPAVRDLSVVPDATVESDGGRRRALDVPAAVQGGGRRRAPEVPAPTSSGGRRRAPEPAAPEMVGGRRRAPEEPTSTGGRRRAPEVAVAAAGPAALLGRHGVAAPPADPGNPGRHRTTDTGLFPAVSGATASLRERGPRAADPTRTESMTERPATAGRGTAVRSVRPVERVASGRASWTAPVGADAEGLTRPMRLSDHAPHARRPRPDRSRPGI